MGCVFVWVCMCVRVCVRVCVFSFILRFYLVSFENIFVITLFLSPTLPLPQLPLVKNPLCVGHDPQVLFNRTKLQDRMDTPNPTHRNHQQEHGKM